MATMLDDIDGAAHRLRDEIRELDWSASARTVNEMAGMVVDALLQTDEDSVVRLNNATAETYAQLVSDHRVSRTAGPQGLADQLGGLSRVVAAAMRRRRSVTRAEADVVAEPLTIRILRHLQQSNRPVSNRQLADALKCWPETIARRITQMRMAGLVRSWPAGRSMLNEITEAGHDSLRAEGRLSNLTPGQQAVVDRLREVNSALTARRDQPAGAPGAKPSPPLNKHWEPPPRPAVDLLPPPTSWPRLSGDRSPSVLAGPVPDDGHNATLEVSSSNRGR